MEKPGEWVKRYLVQLLQDEYKDTVFEVEALPDTYDRLGWAVCHSSAVGVFNYCPEDGAEVSGADLANRLVGTVREGVRRGLPVINGDGPPWYDVVASAMKIVVKETTIRIEVRFDFSTGLVPSGI